MRHAQKRHAGERPAARDRVARAPEVEHRPPPEVMLIALPRSPEDEPRPARPYPDERVPARAHPRGGPLQMRRSVASDDGTDDARRGHLEEHRIAPLADS